MPSWQHTFNKTTKISPVLILFIPSSNTLSRKKDFDYAHPPYDPKFTKHLLRDEGCIHTGDKNFCSVNVGMHHQAQDLSLSLSLSLYNGCFRWNIKVKSPSLYEPKVILCIFIFFFCPLRDWSTYLTFILLSYPY